MKKIVFYILNTEPIENANSYQTKNSLINWNETLNGFYFKSYYKEKK